MLTSLLDFFENLTTLHKLIWIVLCLSIFWLAEGFYPMVPLHYDKWKHSRLNLVLLATTMIINVLFGVATVGIFAWTSEHQFGIFRLLALPVWLELLLSVLVLDLIAQYFVHFLLHKVKFMWRFHMVGLNLRLVY